MARKILYGAIMLMMTVVITVFTLSMQIKKRNQTVFNDYVLQANEGNYTNFLKIQAPHYLPITEITLDSYQVSLYFTDALIVFVRPLKTVTYAMSKEANDQTQLTLEGAVSYDSKDQDNYGDFPISFGLTKMGFYYYQANVTEGNYHMKLTDYEGTTFYDDTLFINTTGDYQKGFTAQEVESKLREDPSYLTPVYITFGVCVALSITFGVFLFYKKK